MGIFLLCTNKLPEHYLFIIQFYIIQHSPTDLVKDTTGIQMLLAPNTMNQKTNKF